MTGRSLHDALLRALTSARLRMRLAAGDDDALPAEEAGVLRAADAERLLRLARFMGRHFYRERIVRLFAASRALARARRLDPLRILEGTAFAAILDGAELGSAATADGVARLVEAELGGVLAALPYAADLIEKGAFKFCWIVDFPMFEFNEEQQKIDFSHNPFSMPQGELEALETKDPLDILAWQYDIVCNGVELSSGAIRNHRPDIMYKAFEIAGYTSAEVDENFSGMINAFKYGAPPHGGSAPGIDRIVMLLADEPNIREVILFPMNQKAEDLMMNAPAPVTAKQLKELSIKVVAEDAPVPKS